MSLSNTHQKLYNRASHAKVGRRKNIALYNYHLMFPVLHRFYGALQRSGHQTRPLPIISKVRLYISMHILHIIGHIWCSKPNQVSVKTHLDYRWLFPNHNGCCSDNLALTNPTTITVMGATTEHVRCTTPRKASTALSFWMVHLWVFSSLSNEFPT